MFFPVCDATASVTLQKYGVWQQFLQTSPAALKMDRGESTWQTEMKKVRFGNMQTGRESWVVKRVKIYLSNRNTVDESYRNIPSTCWRKGGLFDEEAAHIRWWNSKGRIRSANSSPCLSVFTILSSLASPTYTSDFHHEKAVFDSSSGAESIIVNGPVSNLTQRVCKASTLYAKQRRAVKGTGGKWLFL